MEYTIEMRDSIQQMGDYRPFFLEFFDSVTVYVFLNFISGLNFTDYGVDGRGV